MLLRRRAARLGRRRGAAGGGGGGGGAAGDTGAARMRPACGWARCTCACPDAILALAELRAGRGSLCTASRLGLGKRADLPATAASASNPSSTSFARHSDLCPVSATKHDLQSSKSPKTSLSLCPTWGLVSVLLPGFLSFFYRFDPHKHFAMSGTTPTIVPERLYTDGCVAGARAVCAPDPPRLLEEVCAPTSCDLGGVCAVAG